VRQRSPYNIASPEAVLILPLIDRRNLKDFSSAHRRAVRNTRGATIYSPHVARSYVTGPMIDSAFPTWNRAALRSCSDLGCTRLPCRARRIVCRLKPVSRSRTASGIILSLCDSSPRAMPFSPYRTSDGSNVLMSSACSQPRSVPSPIK
jgi:hypothetical protein